MSKMVIEGVKFIKLVDRKLFLSDIGLY